MKPADIITMRTCTYVCGNRSTSYRAPKGRLFTFIMLGAEAADGSDNVDYGKRLNALGWYFVEDAKDQEAIQIDGVWFERRPSGRQPAMEQS